MTGRWHDAPNDLARVDDRFDDRLPVTTGDATASGSRALLTVSELAELLQANEKKIYQLAASGQLPGTKITGRWLFPRRLVDDWLHEHCHGGLLADRLWVVGVADRRFAAACRDTALEWQATGLLGYSPSGLQHGLTMLETRRADACLMHWGRFDATARRHLALLHHRSGSDDWVVVRLLVREDGLWLRPATAPRPLPTFDALLQAPRLRWRLPPAGSATRRFFDEVRGERPIMGTVSAADVEECCPAADLHADRIDVALGSAFEARAHALACLPLGTVGLDLVTTRRNYFRTPMQSLLDRLDAVADPAGVGIGFGYRPASGGRVLSVRDSDSPNSAS